MEYRFHTKGICPKEIVIEYTGDTVDAVHFCGGCNGNGKGIGALTAGMKMDDVIARCEGITCGMKKTSCPDQLARALREIQCQQAGE
ncbi:MAG: TIGR03905 family TSCPD domain-containing protein [Oscillospiraceae bacterium]|nr:TIGR03905 family TSCPD domain-containing protein [Oscillospiraceae bacterium]